MRRDEKTFLTFFLSLGEENHEKWRETVIFVKYKRELLFSKKNSIERNVENEDNEENEEDKGEKDEENKKTTTWNKQIKYNDWKKKKKKKEKRKRKKKTVTKSRSQKEKWKEKLLEIGHRSWPT